jgi:CelD/BcsL family acetyltransferase involved in cellulose biosynthesis
MALAEAGTVVRVDPLSDPRWEQLARGRLGSLFGSPPWIGSLADGYGFEARAELLVDAAGGPVAGLAHAELDDVRGRRLVSLPFSDFLDPIVDTFAQWDELASPLLESGLAVKLRCLRCRVPLDDPRLTRTNVACWHGTALDGSLDEVLAASHPQVRQNIRRAERNGITVRLGTGLEDMRRFHALHRDTRKRKYRLLAQPFAFFESLLERFAKTDSIVVGIAERSGEAIAGAVYLVWNDVLYYKYGASRREGLEFRPNELLARESVRHAIERGCRLYDWGLSERSQPGLVAFKRKLATIEEPITFLRAGPGHETADPRLIRLTERFTHDSVPDEITQRAGEVLYRFFA